MNFSKLGARIHEVINNKVFKFLSICRIRFVDLNIKLLKGIKAKIVAIFLAEISFDFKVVCTFFGIKLIS